MKTMVNRPHKAENQLLGSIQTYKAENQLLGSIQTYKAEN